MRSIALSAVAGALLVLGACAHPDALAPGMTRQQLDARFGPPAASRLESSGEVLIYSSAPLGQRASAVYLDQAGRVTRVEPVLNTEHFATIAIDRWDKAAVLSHFGTPAEIRTIARLEVWSYRYREAETWDSLFDVMFDGTGIVRKTQNGPDPMYEKRDNGRQ